jgi:hypothetical protein
VVVVVIIHKIDFCIYNRMSSYDDNEEEDFLVAITGISLAIIPPLIFAVAEALRPRISLSVKIIHTNRDKVTIRVTATSSEAPIDHIRYVLRDPQGNVIMEGRIPNTTSSNTFTADINIVGDVLIIEHPDYLPFSSLIRSDKT